MKRRPSTSASVSVDHSKLYNCRLMKETNMLILLSNFASCSISDDPLTKLQTTGGELLLSAISLAKLISVQPPRNTRLSSAATINAPPPSSIIAHFVMHHPIFGINFLLCFASLILIILPHTHLISLIVVYVARWLSGRASDLRSSSRGFEARPRRCCVTTLGKFFTPYCLCYKAV